MGWRNSFLYGIGTKGTKHLEASLNREFEINRLLINYKGNDEIWRLSLPPLKLIAEAVNSPMKQI